MDYYQQMLERVDLFFGQTRGRYPGSFACRSGCSGCCRLHLTLFPVEAEAVGKAVAALPPETQQRVRAQADAVDEAHPSCPLLVDDQCTIYDHRPVICRSHGLPVKFEEDGATEIDVCPLNFEDGKIPDDAVLDIDRINELLVSINMFASRQKGVDPGQRTRMADIIREALP